MNMNPESMSRMISQVLLPFGQQWAATNGYPMLSKLLADEQLHGLLSRYGEPMLAAWAEQKARNQKRGPGRAANDDRAAANAESAELQQLAARLGAIEGQHQQVMALLEAVRVKMRPLAKALGCCPECLVGVEICPACWGKSAVGSNPPDVELLKSLIVEPLAAAGVPLRLADNTRHLRVANGRTQPRRETGANHE